MTGWINNIQCGVGGGTCSQNQSYLWDKVGNLTQRQNGNLGLTENFYYDGVYRLDYSQLNGQTNLDMSYDNLGNITSRTDVSNNATWTYDSVHKHQVLTAGSHTYAYDANGNVTSRNGNTINWTSYNYPSQITGPGETINLFYDANRQRYKQVYTANGVSETIHYIGGLLQKVNANGIDDYRYSVMANGQTIALMSRMSNGTNTLPRYVLSDYQGSVAKLTDSSGNSIVSESFTAYGARRNPLTWSGNATYGELSTIAGISREGYTGHTALGSLGLNHMNGRVQDAITGRFLSADPYITEPGNTQNYNRYSYVYNNPLTLIDPSGFRSCSSAIDVFMGSPEFSRRSTLGGGFGTTGLDRNAALEEVEVIAFKNPLYNSVCLLEEPEWISYYDAPSIFGATALESKTCAQGGRCEAPKPQTKNHRYGSKVPTTCKANDAFDSVKDMSAPGAPPAVDGTRRLSLSPLLPSSLQGLVPDYFTHRNPITQVVDSQNRTLLNVAENGHVFYPGTVLTTVTSSGSGSVIDTVGTGTGDHPIFNNIVGAIYFGLRNYLIQVGCDAANGIPSSY